MSNEPESALPHLGYTGNDLLRAAETRGENSLATALAHPGARFYLQSAGRWLSRRGTDDRPALEFTGAEAEARGADFTAAVLLGWTADGHQPRLALAVEEQPTFDATPLESAEDLRALAMKRAVAPGVEGALAQAQHMLTWQRRTRFCGTCGGPTVPEAGGYRRRCTACGELHFPRTDPVAIMLVHDGHGRCILGRQPHFASGMWSCLAGFVEPGETLENAVRRETLEEAGVAVGEVRYLTSQPWPFPGSLMIGCLGVATSADIVIGDDELEACRWFEAAEVAQMLDGTHPEGLSAPGGFAIAHHLLRAFVTMEAENDERRMKTPGG